jgi:hypothetical protein
VGGCVCGEGSCSCRCHARWIVQGGVAGAWPYTFVCCCCCCRHRRCRRQIWPFRRDPAYLRLLLFVVLLATLLVGGAIAFGIWLAIRTPPYCNIGLDACYDCYLYQSEYVEHDKVRTAVPLCRSATSFSSIVGGAGRVALAAGARAPPGPPCTHGCRRRGALATLHRAVACRAARHCAVCRQRHVLLHACRKPCLLVCLVPPRCGNADVPFRQLHHHQGLVGDRFH